RGMLDRDRGLIIHVGSPASIMPWPGATAYICSRWALRGLHEALCMDLAGTGLRSSHVLFGKVSSEYFEANTDSEQHIPTIANIIPVSTPEVCASILQEVIRRPRRDVFYPPMLRAFDLVNHLAPSLVRALVTRTGRQR
ncbi:MAG: SDR family NAD(P)-dependent oxidoreductase, partial [Myxococcota bacterium]